MEGFDMIVFILKEELNPTFILYVVRMSIYCLFEMMLEVYKECE